MTYHTLSCPHCKRILNQTTGTPSFIGNPFRKCPWCGGVYTDCFTEEWITKSPYKRKKHFIGGALIGAIVSFVFSAGLIAMSSGNAWIMFGGGIVVAAVAFALIYFVKKGASEDAIKESLERTKNAKYVALLREAGYKIYPIDGVEVGTVQDSENELSEDMNIAMETDKFIQLH